jgi:acetyl esterase/lipase
MTFQSEDTMERIQKHTMYRLVIFWALLTAAMGCSKSEPDPVGEVVVTKTTDIYYMEGDSSDRHALDVYAPETNVLNTVVLFVPGGAWKQGDKSKYDTLGITLASKYSYTVVVANYRLSNDSSGSAVHPDHVEDVAASFRWVMENIHKYGGDKNRIFLFGQSAGAHLVTLLTTDAQYLARWGYTSEQIRGVISMSGLYTLENLVTLPANPLGLTTADAMMYRVMFQNAFGSFDTAVINPASPARYLRAGLPPFLIIHTELDLPGFSMENEDFYTRMMSLGSVPVTLEKLLQTDYSAETWQSATEMAAAEPAVSAYIGHYAEVVAINEHDHLKAPTSWIKKFIDKY